jgi:hypothetical protein
MVPTATKAEVSTVQTDRFWVEIQTLPLEDCKILEIFRMELYQATGRKPEREPQVPGYPQTGASMHLNRRLKKPMFKEAGISGEKPYPTCAVQIPSTTRVQPIRTNHAVRPGLPQVEMSIHPPTTNPG